MKRPLLMAKKLSTMILAVGPALLLSNHAGAVSFDLSEDVTLDWDTRATYSVGYRLDDPDDGNIAAPSVNNDDGNRNFDKGLMQNRLNIITEFDLNFGDSGIFVRGNAFYDDVYQNSTARYSNGTYSPQVPNDVLLSSNLDDVSRANEFHPDTIEQHGDDIELWDAFFYTSFNAGELPVTFRLGSQAVSWGESIFVPNGINFANGPVDASRLNVPGVQLQEIFRPVGQAYFQFDPSDTVSVEIYYQYEWEQNRLNAAGSYFSVDDFLDQGGENILAPVAVLGADLLSTAPNMVYALLPWAAPSPTVSPFLTVDRIGDRDASDDGQYGIAVRYLAEALQDTEFGFYFINYHDKSPQVGLSTYPNGVDGRWFGALQGFGGQLVLPPQANEGIAGALTGVESTGYFLEYVEDIKLIGLSASFVVGETNVGLEYSMRKDMPVVAAPELLPGRLIGPLSSLPPGTPLDIHSFELADVSHADISVLHFFGPTGFADDVQLTFELAMDYVHDMSDEEVGSSLQPMDEFAWGYQFVLETTFNNVLPNTTLVIPFTFSDAHGNSVFAGSGFRDGHKRANISFKALYGTNLEFNLGYTAFWGDGKADETADGVYTNWLSDRDFVSLSATISF